MGHERPRAAQHGAGLTWEIAATGSEQSFSAGTQMADGTVAVAGLGGAVAVSRDGGRTFATTIRPDRIGIASLLESTRGTLALFGLGSIRTQQITPQQPD